MATRCSIIVEKTCTAYDEGNPNNGMRRTAFYRHWDGYITGTGYDLVRKVTTVMNDYDELKTVHDVDRSLKELMPLSDYESEYYDERPNGSRGLHGDIDYVYVLNFDNGCTISAYKRPRGGSVDSWTQWPSYVLARWEKFYRDGQYLGIVLDEISIKRSWQ